MRDAVEQLLAVSFALTFPLVAGFAVSVSIYVDGLGVKSLILLAAWLAATCFLWALPSVLQRFGARREVLRDERDILILTRSALIAHAATWLFFVVACVVAYWSVGADGSVSVNVLPLALVGGVVIFQMVLVLSNLIQEKAGALHGR